MADNRAVIIIKKKKGGGGHGHHGGAWKVAYADFVTAMMAFFLVMWLMGSDEETKAAIARYFNNPSQKAGNEGDSLHSPGANPAGDQAGLGDSIQTAAGGAHVNDISQKPAGVVQETREMVELLNEVVDGQLINILVDLDLAKFSLPEHIVFNHGKTTFTEKGQIYLNRIGRILQRSKGSITVKTYTEETQADGVPNSTAFDISIMRSVAITDYFISKQWISEERISPVGMEEPEKRKALNSKAATLGGRIEFTLNNGYIN